MWIEGELNTPPADIPPGPLVIGAGWMLEMVRFEHRTIGLFLAAFGIINFDIVGFGHTGKSRFVGFSKSGAPPLPWLNTSMLFELGAAELARTPEELVANFQEAHPHSCIEAGPDASALSKKAKHRIAETYRDDTPIAAVAAHLGVSHAHLSRQFKKDFKLTPISYRHQLRINDAVGRLSQGGDIVEIGNDVGFNDTGRFYKDFRKVTGTSPGKCRLQIKNRQDYRTNEVVETFQR